MTRPGRRSSDDPLEQQARSELQVPTVRAEPEPVPVPSAPQPAPMAPAPAPRARQPRKPERWH